jgi:hypothetical protein
VCLEIGRVDHDRLARGARSGQSFHHAQEHAPLAGASCETQPMGGFAGLRAR